MAANKDNQTIGGDDFHVITTSSNPGNGTVCVSKNQISMDSITESESSIPITQ